MKQIIKTASEVFGIPENLIGEALAEFMMQEMPMIQKTYEKINEPITEHIIQDEFIYWLGFIVMRE